jgi:DNA (cytosine-5)-methyltransferase 1
LDAQYLQTAHGARDGSARCLTKSNQRIDAETETLVSCLDETQVTSKTNRSSCGPETAALTKTGRPPSIAFNARQDPVHGPTTGALDTDGSTQAVCVTGDVTHALRSVGADASEDGTWRGTPIVTSRTQVRRLTPRECERLQGFPDDYTAIPGAKDGPRYAALGNSMAVPVMAWLGRRIQTVDGLLEEAP